jgi:hypothetical protein
MHDADFVFRFGRPEFQVSYRSFVALRTGSPHEAAVGHHLKNIVCAFHGGILQEDFLRRQMDTLSKLGHDRSRPVVASSEVIDVPELEAALDRTFRSNATRKRDRRIKKPVIEPPGDLDAKITH